MEMERTTHWTIDISHPPSCWFQPSDLIINRPNGWQTIFLRCLCVCDLRSLYFHDRSRSLLHRQSRQRHRAGAGEAAARAVRVAGPRAGGAGGGLALRGGDRAGVIADAGLVGIERERG